MYYGKMRTKQGLSYISICSFSILYNSKFILLATSLGTNVVVLTRVHSTTSCSKVVALVLFVFFLFFFCFFLSCGLLAASLFLCFVLVVVLLLCSVGPF